jgi:hypothetical protein
MLVMLLLPPPLIEVQDLHPQEIEVPYIIYMPMYNHFLMSIPLCDVHQENPEGMKEWMKRLRNMEEWLRNMEEWLRNVEERSRGVDVRLRNVDKQQGTHSR